MIPIEGYAFLDALAIGEDYNPLDYNELVGGGKFSDYSAFPEWAGHEFSTGRSHAAGRYQFEPATWRECAASCRLTDFSPASQDIAAWYLAQRVVSGLSGLLRENQLVGIATRLRSTWTSLSERTFPLRYGVALAKIHAAAAIPGSSPETAALPGDQFEPATWRDATIIPGSNASNTQKL